MTKNNTMNEKLIILDGNSLINRAFYALPFLTNSKGQFTGAVFGFANMLIKLIADEKPSHIVVAFDYARKTFRNQIYEQYKQTRKETPSELVPQFALLKEMLSKMNILQIEKEGIEADDIIGTIAKHSSLPTLIVSGDRDVLQLIDDSVQVVLTKKGISQTEIVNKQNIKLLYGYLPEQVIDLKALMGDSSDNIPGIAGIGPKTAIRLLEKYKSLDGIYAGLENEKESLKQKLIENKSIAYISKQLATINTNCQIDFDLEKAKLKFPFSKEVYEFFEQVEFTSILKKSELFELQIEKQETKANFVEFTNLSQVQEFKKQCFENKKIAFNLLSKIEFACNQNFTFFINQNVDLFSNGIEINQCIQCLKEVFESEQIEKVCYDLKTHLTIFKKYGIELKGNVFDISLAEYLINAGLKTNKEIVLSQFMFDKEIQLKSKLQELELDKLYFEIELPLSYVLFSMEEEGFKVDTQGLYQLEQKYKEELDNLTNQIYQSVGETFNINSPKQLAEVLFNKLGLKSYLGKKLSTNIEVLNDLADQHEVIPMVIRYRKIQKLVSTYIDVYKKIVSKSGEIIHTVFNQTLTSTGRLSSSEPNLQNIPIRDDEGKNLRKIFVSKFENGYIVSADYNQIELRLLASFSGDENMINAFKNNIDIHTLTASQIFKLPLSEISPQMRRDAKAVNFGIIYGISDFGLATNIGVPRKHAKLYIEKYFENYPMVKKYMDANIEMAKNLGYVKTLFNRIRNIPEISSSNYQLRQFGERVAMNMPLQGSASDIIKLAMIGVHKKLKEKNLESKLILQIHDELIVDCAENELNEVKQILQSVMENAVKLEVDLPVEISSGKTWFDCK